MRKTLLTGLLLLPLQLAFAAAAPQDPTPLDAQGMVTPLLEAQLTDEERQAFESLDPGSEDRTRFLYTRAYLRFCVQVVQRARPPLQLPPLPSRRHWNRAFLSAAEAKNIVDVALGMKMVARMPPASPGPSPA